MTRAAVPGTGPAQKRLSPGGPEFPYVFLYVKIRDGPVFFFTKKRPDSHMQVYAPNLQPLCLRQYAVQLHAGPLHEAVSRQGHGPLSMGDVR